VTSDAQLAANRANAARSTGPKTAEGREAARRNALRHGLTAKQLVLPEEEAADFMSFHDELRAALAPEGAVEELLVERIVLCAWRLRRVYRAEAGMAASKNRDWISARENDGFKAPAGLVFARAPAEILALTRYERSIERSLHRTFKALQTWQENRRADAELELDADGYPIPRPPDPRLLWELPGVSEEPSPHLPRINGFPALGEEK